jgi:hypothetical protein
LTSERVGPIRSGTLERIVKTSSDLWLEGLGDDGSMMYMVDWVTANQRSFVGPSGRTTLVGHGLGRAFFYQGKWYVLIGRSWRCRRSRRGVNDSCGTCEHTFRWRRAKTDEVHVVGGTCNDLVCTRDG